MTNDQKAILALTRENAALAARLAELDTRLTDAVAKHGEVARQFGELLERLAEAERDAARYRYLRGATGWSIQQWLGLTGVWTEYLSGKTLDQSIDEAMEGGE